MTEFVPESSWHVPASAEVQSFRAASRLLDTENDGCAPKRTQQASQCTELSERTSKVTTGQIYPTSLLNLNKFSTIRWTFSRAFLRIKLSATRIFKARPAARECTRHPPPPPKKKMAIMQLTWAPNTRRVVIHGNKYIFTETKTRTYKNNSPTS